MCHLAQCLPSTEEKQTVWTETEEVSGARRMCIVIGDISAINAGITLQQYHWDGQ